MTDSAIVPPNTTITAPTATGTTTNGTSATEIIMFRPTESRVDLQP